jgi:hypothetical protein
MNTNIIATDESSNTVTLRLYGTPFGERDARYYVLTWDNGHIMVSNEEPTHLTPNSRRHIRRLAIEALDRARRA